MDYVIKVRVKISTSSLYNKLHFWNVMTCYYHRVSDNDNSNTVGEGYAYIYSIVSGLYAIVSMVLSLACMVLSLLYCLWPVWYCHFYAKSKEELEIKSIRFVSHSCSLASSQPMYEIYNCNNINRVKDMCMECGYNVFVQLQQAKKKEQKKIENYKFITIKVAFRLFNISRKIMKTEYRKTHTI